MHHRLASHKRVLRAATVSALFLFSTSAAFPSEPPRIFWASDPVLPNETVLLQGSDLGGAAASVELARLRDGNAAPAAAAAPSQLTWTAAPVVQPGGQSMKFVIPKDWQPGLFACRVKSAGATSEPIYLNAPDVWWLQGDEGEAATSGGWLRLCGKSLGKAAQIRLEPENAAASASLTLLPSLADDYTLSAVLPATLAAGRYTVRVHNGAGGPFGWRTAGALQVDPPRLLKPEVFSVLDGPEAVTEMRKTLNKYAQPVDRTAGILAALRKARENGGGTVYFPAGRYSIKGSLSIPEHTLLQGEGEGLVTLWWGTGHFNLDGGGPQGRALPDEPPPPATLIEGPDFAMQDMSLYLPLHYVQGIVADKRFRMTRVRVRIDHYWLVQGRGDGVVARLGGNFQVRDCDILAKGDGLALGQYGVVSHNRIAANKSNTPMGGARQVIIEENHFVSMDPTAYQNISGTGRDIYYAHNQHEALYAQQSDYSFTFDAGAGAYLGALSEVSGTHVTLAADPIYPQWAPEKSREWHRAALFILDGHGAGQWRGVVSNQGRAWEIERPFDTAPDASSVASIVLFNGRVLIIGNRFEDASWVNAGYGTSIDVICAGNHLARCAEFMNHGVRAESHGFEPSWHVQYFDNEIAEGLTNIGSGGTGHDNEPGYTGTLNWCAIHRRHHVTSDNSGGISIGGRVVDVIVEGCHLDNPASTVRTDDSARGVVLRDNTIAPLPPAP